MADFSWSGIGQTLKSGMLGDVNYDPETMKLEQEKANQERDLAMKSRGDQAALGQALRNQMAGKGPSVAQNQMQTGREQMMRAATSASAGARGSGVAAANKQGMTTAQNIGAGVNRDAATLRAQEVQAATKMAVDQAYQQRMQDLMSRGMSIDEAKAQLDYYAKLQSTRMQGAIAEQQGAQQGVAGVMGMAAGALGAVSGMETKTNVQPAGSSPMPEQPIDEGFRPNPAKTSFISATRPVGPEPKPVPGQNMDIKLASPDQPGSSGGPPSKSLGALRGALAGYSSGLSGRPDVLKGTLDDMRRQQAEWDAKNPKTGMSQFDQDVMNSGMETKSNVQQMGGSPSPNPEADMAKMQTTQPSGSDWQAPQTEKKTGLAAIPVVGSMVQGFGSDDKIKKVEVLSQENAALKAALGVKQGKKVGKSALPSMVVDQPSQTAEPQFVNESGAQSFGKVGYPSEVKKTMPPKLAYPAGLGQDPNDPWKYRTLDEKTGQVVTGYRNPQPGSVAVGSAGRPASNIPDFTSPVYMQLPGGGSIGKPPAAREAMPSDERAKKAVALGSALSKSKEQKFPVTEELAQLPTIRYNYENNELGNFKDMYGPQKFTGTSANVMEKLPSTAPAVKRGPNGVRMVDPTIATMTNLGATAELSRRVQELEAQKEADNQALKTLVDSGSKPGAALKSSLKKKAVGSTTHPAVYEEGFTPPEQGPMKRGLVPYSATPKAIERQRAVDMEYRADQGEDAPSMRGELSGIEGQIAKEGTEQYSGLPSRFYGEQRGKTPVEYKFGMPAPVYQTESPSGAKLKAPKIQSDEEAKLYHEEQKSNAAHALRQALAAKNPQKVRNLVRAFDKRARGWYETSQPSNPKLIQQQLESRGVKMSTKQIADALREETDL